MTTVASQLRQDKQLTPDARPSYPAYAAAVATKAGQATVLLSCRRNNSKKKTGMHARIAKLLEVCVIRVDYVIIGHFKNSKVRRTERTLWRQQVRAYLKYQEWDNPNIPC
eukprot:11570034-Heterocapsa_arctica.AAC.1